MPEVTALIGADRGLAERALGRLFGEAGVDPASPDVVRLDGREAGIAEAREALRHVAWTGGRRVVVLWNAPLVQGTKDMDLLAGWAAEDASPGEPWLVLWAPEADRRLRAVKALEGGRRVVGVAPMDARSARREVAAMAKALGGGIEAEAAARLVDMVGTDFSRLEQEVAKLLSLTDGAPITADDVARASTGRPNLSVFRLTEAVSEKRAADAMGLVRPLLDAGESAIGLLALVAREFRLLAKARRSASEGGSLRGLGLPEFVARRLARSAALWSDGEIAAAFPKLLDADLRLKSGGRGDVTLEVLIAELLG